MPVKEPKRIKVSPTSELANVLAAARASGEPILVDTGETVYPLSVQEGRQLDTIEDEGRPFVGMLAGYDPAKVREALTASAGALAGVDIQQLLSDIYAAREQNSSGRSA